MGNFDVVHPLGMWIYDSLNKKNATLTNHDISNLFFKKFGLLVTLPLSCKSSPPLFLAKRQKKSDTLVYLSQM